MRTLVLSLALLLFVGFSDPAAAQFGPRRGVESGQLQPLDRILDNIRRSWPGQLSDVQGPYPGAGGPVYRIKWFTPDGRVLWLTVDGRSGGVLGVEGDDRGGGRFRFR